MRKLLEEHKGEVAGVILEPVVGNSGFIPPTQEFLQGLRELTQAEGTLLIFDEVMTGFRCPLPPHACWQHCPSARRVAPDRDWGRAGYPRAAPRSTLASRPT